jgi:RND family efflux transporter MFP subunit
MIGMLEPLLRKARPAAAVGSRAWWIRIAAAAAVLGALLVPVPSTITADATVRPAVPIAVRASTAGTIEEVLVSEGQWVEAGAVVARMRRDELVMKLEQVRAGVQRARAEAARARAAGAFADYRAREAEGSSLEEQQRFLEGELGRTELVSPVRGVVLTSRVELRRGQRLERGATFLDLADVSNMVVEVSVPEQEVEGVRPGAPAQLKVYSYPERTFRGEVIRVAPRANESRTFTVTVRMPNADRALRSGMSGRARLDVPARPFLWPLVAPIVRWVRMSLWV